MAKALIGHGSPRTAADIARYHACITDARRRCPVAAATRPPRYRRPAKKPVSSAAAAVAPIPPKTSGAW